MPDLNGQIGFTVEYDLANLKLKLQLTTTLVSPDKENLLAYFKIKQPDCVTRIGNFVSPDVQWSVVDSKFPVFEFPLRPASGGGHQRGVYEITVYGECTGFTNGEMLRTINFQLQAPLLKPTPKFDCFLPYLYCKDETNYDSAEYNISSLTRAWNVLSNAGNLTGSAQNINLAISGSYYDSKYAITLTSTVAWQHIFDTWLTATFSKSISVIKAAFIPESIATLTTYLQGVKEADSGSCNSGCGDSVYDTALALYTEIRGLICAQNTANLEELFDRFYRITHNGQSKVYVNTDAVIPTYDFASGCTVTPPPTDTTLIIIECVIGNAPVVIGTAEPVVGLTNGSTVVTCQALMNRRVMIVRGSIPVPMIDPLDGSGYATKVLGANNISFSMPLAIGEYVKIQTIN